MSDETIHLDRRTDEGPPMAAACGTWAKRETGDRSAVTCSACLAAPICTKCGATLPDPMVRAVVTCPGCGAKSEARTSVPEISGMAMDKAVGFVLAALGAGHDEGYLRGHAAGVAEDRARCEALIITESIRWTPEGRTGKALQEIWCAIRQP